MSSLPAKPHSVTTILIVSHISSSFVFFFFVVTRLSKSRVILDELMVCGTERQKLL